MKTRKLYHSTSEDAARAILKNGFKDSVDRRYGDELKVVWLSDGPLDSNDHGNASDVLLSVEVTLSEEKWDELEYDEDPYKKDEHGEYVRNKQGKRIRVKSYREWCIPAKTVNRFKIKRVST